MDVQGVVGHRQLTLGDEIAVPTPVLRLGLHVHVLDVPPQAPVGVRHVPARLATDVRSVLVRDEEAGRQFNRTILVSVSA